MASPRIALMSLACRYPEADDTESLWQNVLDGRRSFRPIPDSRLALGDYDVARVGEADSIPRIPAGLLTDWQFSRARYHVPRATYETTDLTHWLALDVAAEAIDGIGGADALPRDRTAVIIGDTLTGEFTRSAQLRLRAPYLGRRLEAVLSARGLTHPDISEIVAGFIDTVCDDFPDPNEESLAGALANTIAGRIANHFDFHGGAWTVDGACASSLLAIADGCGRLMAGDADAVVVGGVDLSLDPFELVGFARAGALAREDMRVFDRRAAGFWPGEGCGIAVLATEAAASRMGGTPLCWVRGWGVSTDGAGGLTRPTTAGQARALDRAWRRAGCDPAQAGLFEAHGTGTAVGDPTELRGLAELAGPDARGIPVGSIKANIGHCKAAAGMAGIVKAACALRYGVVPPHVGCEDPSPVFADTGHRLAPAEAGTWRGAPFAGVSGFGFGGVNAHVVLEGTPTRVPARPRAPRPQDAELFVFAANDPAALRSDLTALRDRASSLSFGEMIDAAADASATADPGAPYRAAVVADRPEALRDGLDSALCTLSDRPAAADGPPRIGFLFPGQAAPVRPSGSAWSRRFPQDRDLIGALDGVVRPGDTTTRAAQPAIVASSLAALRVLSRVGLHADAVAGHSLGELCALAWGGAFDMATCLEIAAARGAAMATHGRPQGAMARVPLGAEAATALAARHGLVVACLNGAQETVLAGRKEAIDRLLAETTGETLRVSHAFHSADMAPAAAAFAGILDRTGIGHVSEHVVSTVTGERLSAGTDLRAVLLDQLTHPVRFTDALATLAGCTDFLIEVGPGAGLTRLVTDAGLTCMPTDAGGATLRPLLHVLAEAWRRGARLDIAPLFADRPTRKLSATPPKLLGNPCGLHADSPALPVRARTPRDAEPAHEIAPAAPDEALAIVREAVADELGLPIESVAVDARLLDDLHLNSLSVGRIVAAAAARLGMASPAAVMDLSNVSTADVAAYLTELHTLGEAGSPADDRVEGVAPWIAEFETLWVSADVPARADTAPRWRHFGDALPPAARTLPLSDEGDGDGALIILGTDKTMALGADAILNLWTHVKSARASNARHIAVVHQGAAIEGFVRSLVADGSFRSAIVIDMAARPDGWADVDALLHTVARGVSSWQLAPRAGVLRPMLARLPEPSTAAAALGPDDVVLVVGGARGIGAECALRLAASLGVALALVGRSPAESDPVTETLARAAAIGVRAAYRQADAASAESMQAAVAAFAAEGLVPTVALHAAGVNNPASFDDLDTAALCATLAPKLDGLDALLGALDRSRLKLVACFGSIIGALGLAGETHYALANAAMAERLTRWGADTGVRTLALDWSVWAGVGMGERLGTVERLRRTGVDAIPLDTALTRFAALVADASHSGRRIVTSRFGPPPHVRFAVPETPMLRFVETPKVHFPDVELVADAILSPGSDPWLDDHVVDGTPVVPGVMLLEAAAQAALALTGKPAESFADVRFDHAVAVTGPSVTLRTAALHDGSGRVRVVLRASDDGFSADRASMTVQAHAAAAPDAPDPTVASGDWRAADLYGPLFFNKGRFQRIAALEMVCARASRVRLTAPAPEQPGGGWFGPFLPREMVLGDPGARDAGLHALQACAPQRRILPVGAARIVVLDKQAPRALAEARETWSDGDRFRFDIAWRDPQGRLVEVWQDALFRAVSVQPVANLPLWALPAALERAAITLDGQTDLRIALETEGPRATRRSTALARLGLRDLCHRGDGAPQSADGANVSISHGADVVLAATGTAPVGVDLVESGEPCRPALQATDQALARDIAALAGWNPSSSAAAIWATREALRKVGAPLAGSLHLETAPRTGGVVLRREGYRVICLGCGSDGCAALALPIATSAAPAATVDAGRSADPLSTAV